jgi:hypothetical protein
MGCRIPVAAMGQFEHEFGSSSATALGDVTMKANTILLATAILGGAAYGADSGPNYKHLKLFDAYVGTWVKHGPLKEDLFFGKKGDVGTSTITWKWGYSKNVVDWQWQFDFGGQRSGTKGAMAWDPIQGKVTGAGVRSDGGLIRATIRSKDAPLTIHVEFVAPDGKATSHVETFTVIGHDTMTIKITERKGGQVTADSPEYVFTRVSRKPGPNYEHLKFYRPLIGTWRYEGPLLEDIPGIAKKGAKYVDQATWRWILNRNAVEFVWSSEFEGGRRISGKGLSWWDASKKQIFATSMDTTGSVSHGTIVMKNAGKYSSYTSTGTTGEGEKTTFTGVLQRTDKDTLIFHAAERTGGLVEGPGPKYELKRIKMSDRSKQSD